MDYLNDYYSAYDEEGRLLSRHGQVEYLTTRRYLDGYLFPDAKILEIGAGTGRYSVTLAQEGYDVTAVELIPHNIEILKSKLTGGERITVHQGNALDLSMIQDNAYDVTLLLGPMYHLCTQEERLQALKEAVRATKPGGILLVAYCMNDATVVQFVFQGNHVQFVRDNHMLTADWHCLSQPKDLFAMVRTEEIAALDAAVPVERLGLIASDGATNYMRPLIDGMDDATFAQRLDYHFATCQRQDLVGASNHTVDLLKKKADAEK